MLKTDLTQKQIQCIKNQRFNDNEPGTLLKDFSNLLDFIGTTGITVSKKNHLFAIKLLPSLNELMTNPLESQLKRPQQKSFPHINGLYLLLRASGLTHLVHEKKEIKLVVDRSALESWNSLNPTECYFALFYAWWHRGSDEIIGERGRGFCENYFYETGSFFQRTLCKGLDIKAENSNFDFLRYRPGLHNLALMELFGFIQIELNSELSKENWPIAKIKPTNWGSALLKCLSKEMTIFDDFEHSDNEHKESWGSELKAYLPSWKKNLDQKEIDGLKEDVVIFKVSLGKVYRKLAVPGAISLDELASSILAAFNFSNDHLYQFYYKNKYGITERIVHSFVDSEYEMYTNEYAVAELALYEGMEIVFNFDFGDDWQFLMTVESFAAHDPSNIEPKVIKQYGTPPEQYPDWDSDWDE